MLFQVCYVGLYCLPRVHFAMLIGIPISIVVMYLKLCFSSSLCNVYYAAIAIDQTKTFLF